MLFWNELILFRNTSVLKSIILELENLEMIDQICFDSKFLQDRIKVKASIENYQAYHWMNGPIRSLFYIRRLKPKATYPIHLR